MNLAQNPAEGRADDEPQAESRSHQTKAFGTSSRRRDVRNVRVTRRQCSRRHAGNDTRHEQPAHAWRQSDHHESCRRACEGKQNHRPSPELIGQYAQNRGGKKLHERERPTSQPNWCEPAATSPPSNSITSRGKTGTIMPNPITISITVINTKPMAGLR